MPVPGKIDLGRHRVVYEQETESGEGTEGCLLQQRAIVRLNEDLIKLERPGDFTVLCNEEEFRKRTGKRPSPLQYFIASIGFCMLTQLSRFAARLEVLIEDAEMDLRMTYEVGRKLRSFDFSNRAHGLTYLFKLQSLAPTERLIKAVQLADKGCHTVNSMRKRVPVSGKLVLNGREFEIID